MTLAAIRDQFPALQQQINGYPLVYLDTAATSQKPQRVIDAVTHFYRSNNANVHRASHQLSSKATLAYEAVRQQLQLFIGATNTVEIIFTHGTTESLNLVANGLKSQITANDIILVDNSAHHANLVPWQQIAIQQRARVLPIPLDEHCRLDKAAFIELLKLKPKIVALNHVSNILGTVNPIKELCQLIRDAGAISVVDGAQAVAHIEIDVTQLGCDFYAFSGHKMYAPTGVGVLWGKHHLLNKLTPLLTGGEMIKQVSFKQTDFGELPNRLEAGTPPIEAVIGLGEAIQFLNELDRPALAAAENLLLQELQQQLAAINGISLIGAHSDNISAVAFNLTGEHHQDIGALLDQQGVAVRCGHHCAMPLMEALGIKGCCRVSLGIYSTQLDIQRFIAALTDTINLLSPEID